MFLCHILCTKYINVTVQSSLLRYPLNNFTTVKLYKPSKFEDIKKKLFLKKRLFNIIYKKKANDIKREPFYDNITQYTQNKRKIYQNDKYNVKETKYKDIEEENKEVKQNEHVCINKNVNNNLYTNHHTSNDKCLQQKKEKKKELINIEKILFKTTTFSYIELQYILSTFIYYEKENITTDDLLNLYNFVNLSEKDIYDYLSANELIPEEFLRTRIITNLLKFINVNHPSLK
ncbi:conserved Plasmodium protein, unknown function [Plasmodium sp. gorilla clade G3]|nr:conserved Plasmodium protein, unknown function [Plasmodium sp. gorilla clade G3]